MPAKYEAIRDKLISEGMSEDEAQTRAAKIYNSQRKPGQEPVTGKHKKKKKTKPGAVDDNAMKRVREYYKKVRQAAD